MKLIPLTQGQSAMVDDEWFGKLNQYKWHALNGHGYTFYAVRHRPLVHRDLIYMHGDIMVAKLATAPNGTTVDHIDHNGLNNVTSNLRLATKSEQNHNQKLGRSNNTSGFKGVSLKKDSRKWRSYIFYCRKQIHIGSYDTPEEAARAYDAKARELFGEFALTNFNA